MPSSLLKKLSLAFDYYTGRYEVFEAKDADLATCYAIRQRVFGDELKREGGRAAYSLADQDEFDEKSTHLACRDTKTGEIVATVRITRADVFKGNAKFEKEYGLSYFPQDLLSRVAVVSRLVVLKEHRSKGAVGPTISVACYTHGMDSTAISCIVCEPHLFPMYRRLGYRPLGRVQVSPFGGYRLPLFLVIHDYEHLEKVNSPFYAVARKKKFPQVRDGMQWYFQFLLENGHRAASYSVVSEENADDYHSALTANLSEDGKKEILRNAIQLECNFGDVVLAEGTGGRTIGFVKKGALEVTRKKKLVAVLGEGDVFGEVGFILDVPRIATVVAASEKTEIVLLRLTSIERLEDPEDRITVWRNLAQILARRLETTIP